MTWTPERIISIINQTSKGFTEREKNDLKRYFIRHFCPWLPLRYIANLTGVKSHDCVIDSIERVDSQRKYLDIKLALKDLRV
jgi:hypothetical protein